MSNLVVLSDNAATDIELVEPIYLRLVVNAIKSLTVDSLPNDVEFLEFTDGTKAYRISRGPYVIHYRINQNPDMIDVFQIKSIKDI